ncbi:unnamed protein product, partial [Acanthoscelides obtectus]
TNNAYSRKIGELEERAKEDRCRLSENTEGNANDQQNVLDTRDKQLRTTEENDSAKTSKNLLIVGNQLARNCARVLHNSMKSIGYIVEGIVKPNTEAANITSNIFTQTMDYGQGDYRGIENNHEWMRENGHRISHEICSITNLPMNSRCNIAEFTSVKE